MLPHLERGAAIVGVRGKTSGSSAGSDTHPRRGTELVSGRSFQCHPRPAQSEKWRGPDRDEPPVRAVILGTFATLQYRHPLVRLQQQMRDAAGLERMALEQDRRISEVVKREQSRLRNFIRRRVPDPRDAEDILQDVFYELVEANRLLMPIEHVTGWLFRVARNRITDLFRKKRPESFSDTTVGDEGDDLLQLEDLLPSPDAGPEALYARHVLLDELELSIAELPEEQREVFVAHELEGRSFKEMAAESGVSLNTLLSRKRYAVRHLRDRLQSIYDEFTKG